MSDFLQFLNNHQSLSIFLGLNVFLIAVNELALQAFSLPDISPQQLTSLINTNAAVMFDIRNPDAFARGHIQGALSMAISELALKASWLRQKYKNKLMILVSDDTVPFSRDLFKLKKANVPLKALAGGLQAWKNQGLPLSTK